MKIQRRTYIAAPLVLVFALVFSATAGIQASALSLNDVTNTLGNVLGLNNRNNTSEPAAQQTTPQVAPVQSSEPTATTPADSATTSPAATATNATARTPQPAQMTTNAPVSPVQAVTPNTADTGAIVKQLATAQTNRAIAPVVYSSSRIGSDIRDELYAVASVVAVVGVALYGMTFVGASRSIPEIQRRPLFIK